MTMKTETKQQAFLLFETNRAEFLKYARWMAKQLAEKRGVITIDDVREVVSLPEGIDGRAFGAVFNTPEWETVGFTRSKNKLNHGRPISQFRLKRKGQLF